MLIVQAQITATLQPLLTSPLPSFPPHVQMNESCSGRFRYSLDLGVCACVELLDPSPRPAPTIILTLCSSCVLLHSGAGHLETADGLASLHMLANRKS